MTRKEIVAFLTHEKDLDLAQLVKEVEQERKAKEDNDRTLWLADVAEAQGCLLDTLVNYIETIFGEVLTKAEVDDFQKGLNNMTAQLIKMKECGKPVMAPKVWIPKKDENEDFLKAFAKML